AVFGYVAQLDDEAAVGGRIDCGPVELIESDRCVFLQIIGGDRQCRFDGSAIGLTFATATESNHHLVGAAQVSSGQRDNTDVAYAIPNRDDLSRLDADWKRANFFSVNVNLPIHVSAEVPQGYDRAQTPHTLVASKSHDP